MNLRKNLEIHPNPIVEVGSPVSRVEMNAKGAPLTPACPHRRLSTRFSRPRAVKMALTKPTQSYTANLIKPLFRGAAHGRMEEKVGLLFFSWFSYFRLRY
jgi:hypothetical protein